MSNRIAAWVLLTFIMAAPAHSQESPAALQPAASQIDILIGHYQTAVAAMEGADFETYERHIREALALEPGHPALQRHLARALALQGRSNEAIAALAKLVASGTDFSIDEDEYLSSLYEMDAFKALVLQVDMLAVPMGEAPLGYELDERDLLPECAWMSYPLIFFLLKKRSHRKSS